MLLIDNFCHVVGVYSILIFTPHINHIIVFQCTEAEISLIRTGASLIPKKAGLNDVEGVCKVAFQIKFNKC